MSPTQVRAALTTGANGPVMLIVGYVLAMPFLTGLPRGTGVPLLRPSEALQLVVTGIGAAMVVAAVIAGRRWRLLIGRVEWWLLAMTATASVVPLLWLMVRSQSIGSDELMAVFPFVKYAALFALARLCISSEADVAAVAKALIGSALVLSVISVSQALGVGPVIDVLSRFFVSSTEDIVDGGRGTTTIGSSIATGAYLSMVCGLSLSWGLAAGNRLLLAAAAILAVGALGSGQAGSVLAIVIIAAVVAHRFGRLAQLAALAVPLGLLATLALWPIIAARLAVLDRGSGLPQSWVIRWNNVSELYLPSLADGGWVLGVNPNAIVQPPDVWRDAVYLESGYLWLLWVGGLPLFMAATGFLVAAYRRLGADGAIGHMSEAGSTLVGARIAGQAAVVMIGVLSLLDPHLTLRGGADVFFVIIAAGSALRPIAAPVAVSAVRWRTLMAADTSMADHAGARLQFRERATVDGAEAAFTITVVNDGTRVAETALALHRHGSRLRGVVTESPVGADEQSAGLAWRTLVLVADSLRLHELHWGEPTGLPGTVKAAIADRSELKLGARVAEELEIERVAIGHRFSRLRATAEVSAASDGDPPPAIRLDPDVRLPAWKRAVDLGIGLTAMVVTAPLWLTTAALVRRSSPGPVLYRQVRIGTGGLPFQIYKFRTMFVNNDDAAHRLQNKLELRGEADASKDSDDPRITPVGRVLRRLSLDELPQLINVIRSEMSLVGPRPSLLWESELFEPSTRRRLVARPGLTGLWQISGRADVSMSEMLELDLEYVDRMGPAIDLRCLVGTVASVAAGEGAR